LTATIPYSSLFDASAPPARMDAASVGEFLRCSLGLSAWKQYRESRWALRVNPSSGNLHPTEGYVVRDGHVFHYAPREHALEERAALDSARWRDFSGGRDGFLVGLTSIHWREAWKYGERAFRYCQHDTGHAIAALRFAAALLGWQLTLLTGWTDSQIATLVGIDRDADFADAEREEPECLAVVTPGDVSPWHAADPAALVEAARHAAWSGAANQLSPSRVEWPIIDEVAAATRRHTAMPPAPPHLRTPAPPHLRTPAPPHLRTPAPPHLRTPAPSSLARQIIVHRRSALGFDARSSLPRERFIAMLHRLQPGRPPFDAIDWPPHVHLLLFVHRVDGMTPGVYAYLRDPAVVVEWQAAMRAEFLWEPISESHHPNDSNDSNALFLLVPTDVTWIANRLSCDQDIAADGFFSLGMVARMESPLAGRGHWFYRRLFWESGIIGQVLYLEAEAAGARATGIGCFYDDPVHEMAGLTGHEWQSVYHFSMGVPVDDGRLTTEPGYAWEAAG
jgi:SagB-type dehydrogenase family enzyme